MSFLSRIKINKETDCSLKEKEKISSSLFVFFFISVFKYSNSSHTHTHTHTHTYTQNKHCTINVNFISSPLKVVLLKRNENNELRNVYMLNFYIIDYGGNKKKTKFYIYI